MSSVLKRVQSLGHWGAFEAIIEGDRLVATVPFGKDRNPTNLLESIPSAIHAPCRIERPMIRAGWLQKREKSDREGRGKEDFVAVSWDKAISLVAEELKRVRQDFGNESIFNGACGWASAGHFHHARTQLRRFLNGYGGFTYHVANFSYGAGITILPHLLGSTQPLSGPATDWRTIVSDCELVVSFGGMPLKNIQIESGGMGEHVTEEWMRKARAAGVRFVNVSPCASDMAGFFEAEWISPRPNTDTALMLALAYVLVKDGTYDRSWLDRYTVGFDRFLSYLSGESDGRPKDPDWAAAICEISADRIRDLARCMRRAKTMITVSWSVQRSDHGEQPYWAAITLAAMLGGIGLPGQGISFGFGSINRQGVPTPNMPAPRLPAGTNPVKRFVPSAKVSDMLLNPGKTIDFNGEKIVYPDIKLLYFSGSNPFHHHQNTNMLLRAFHQPETIVIHEPWWTPTARHADIVLPATTTLERNDLGSGSLDRYLFAMKRALAPLHLSRNDHDIFADVADALGFRDAFTEQRSEMAWLRVMYETMRSETAKRGVDMPVFEEFWESGHVSFEVPQSPFISFAAFREDPVANPLKTPSGKIEIFSEKIHSFGYDDCPGHATWIEPAEWLGSEQARRYPLHLLTNQPRHRLHSQMDMGATSFAAKVQGREPIWIHPDDAAARNIRDGDVVRVFNDRGACLAGAVVTPNVRRQVAILSTGAWYDPLEPGNVGALDVHGSANMLTIDKGCSKLSQSPSAQTALVEIELWREPLPEISVFAPPAQRLREDSQQDRGDR